MDRGAWRAIVHGVTKSQTRLKRLSSSSSSGKESVCDAGDLGLIAGLRRFTGGRHGNPHQYSCLEDPMDRGAWQATVHGVTKSWTQLKQLKQQL